MRSARIAWAATAVGLALLAQGCGGDGNEGPASVNPEDGHILFRFSMFRTATRLDGGKVSLDSMWGKVVLLDLFGTWCAPCRRSTPILVSLYERYHDSGFEIVGLAFEQSADRPRDKDGVEFFSSQDKDAVEAFRREFAVPYVLACGREVVWTELRKRAAVAAEVPTILLVDRQGVVRNIFPGIPPGHEAVLADRIERLLAEPAIPMPGAPK
jgi:thiol-disulfide isomerase/thioredoxin